MPFFTTCLQHTVVTFGNFCTKTEVSILTQFENMFINFGFFFQGRSFSLQCVSHKISDSKIGTNLLPI